MRMSTPSWQFKVAYVLLVAPIIYAALAGGPYPVPADHALKLYVCVGLAVGAALFILSRRPRNVAGWLGLVGWGGVSAGAILYALAN